MSEPKFKVGDRFYLGYTRHDYWESILNKQLIVVVVAVITKITIDKHNIKYTTKEFVKTNDGFDTREREKTEREIESYHKTIDAEIHQIGEKLKEKFDFLETEVAKEKLSDVLNGK